MKKNLQFITTLLLAFAIQHTFAQWTQTRQSIDGEFANDNFGFSVSMSADGQTVATSAPYSSHPGFGVGHVQVYKNTGGTWTQVGQDIIGDAQGDVFGTAISLSDDGSILAISAPQSDIPLSNTGIVKVYENSGGTWTQIGQNIGGTNAGDRSGKSVSLSGDGLSVAIGAPAHGSGAVGQVRVFKNIGGSWVQQGSDMDGIGNQAQFGQSVSMSADGLTLVVGSRNASMTSQSEGSARVFNFNGTDWIQKGAAIFGEAANDNAGIAVSINADGSIIAVGANNNDGTGSNAGHVRIYEYVTGAWVQIGQDIDGEATNDESGLSLSMNGDGSIIVIGAKGNDGGGNISGHARVYENTGGTWTQIGLDIDGAAADQSGWSVDISQDGSTVVVGAPYNSETAQNAGQAKVYQFPNLVNITTNDNSLDLNLFPNPSFGKLYLETTSSQEEKVIEIRNAQGQTVETITTSDNLIDVSDLIKGIYLLQIQIGDAVTTEKLIKD